jgi:D-sedoheptulose 7-phosphate isomerase
MIKYTQKVVPMDYTNAINEYLALEIAVLQKLDRQEINAFINALDEARKRDATIYIFGNGGSAATASHFANDFNRGVSEQLEQKFRFVCLNDNIATVMAIANDFSYDEIFEFQLRGKVSANDLVIAISGSGNSPNVLRAIELAKSVRAKTVGLTGYDGGKLRRLVDFSVHVPVMSIQVAEDVHMIFDHLIMAILYKELCGKDHLKGGGA